MLVELPLLELLLPVVRLLLVLVVVLLLLEREARGAEHRGGGVAERVEGGVVHARPQATQAAPVRGAQQPDVHAVGHPVNGHGTVAHLGRR